MTFGLICAFVLAVPWAASIVLPVVGTSTRVVGFVLSGVWVASVLTADKIRPLTMPHRVAFAWVLWCGVGIFWTVNSVDGFLRLGQYVQLFAFTVIVWNSRLDRRDMALVLQSYVVGCWITFFLLLANVLSGNVTQWQRRATIENANENEVGLVLALGMTAAWYLASGRSDEHAWVRSLRLSNYLFIGAGFLGIMYTASRGSFLSTIPFVLYLLSTARRLSVTRRVGAGFAVGAIMTGAYLLVPQSAWDRIGTIPSQLQERDLGSRFGIWGEGLSFLLQDASSFLFGQGPVSFGPLVGRAAHNIWLSVAVETGAVGFILFASMAVMVGGAVLRLRPVDRNMWLAMFGTFALASMALSLEYHKVTWMLFALVLANAGAPDARKDPSDVEAGVPPVRNRPMIAVGEPPG